MISFPIVVDRAVLAGCERRPHVSSVDQILVNTSASRDPLAGMHEDKSYDSGDMIRRQLLYPLYQCRAALSQCWYSIS